MAAEPGAVPEQERHVAHVELAAVFQPELWHEPLAERRVQTVCLADDVEVAAALELEEGECLRTEAADVGRL